jgi:hypothetical protein
VCIAPNYCRPDSGYRPGWRNLTPGGGGPGRRAPWGGGRVAAPLPLVVVDGHTNHAALAALLVLPL